MAAAMIKTLESRSLVEPISLLENGDRLSCPEFKRRHNAMPNVRAELIKGVVYAASPVRYKNQGLPHSHVIEWVNLYRYATPGVDSADNTSIQVCINEDDYVEDAPELIVEVASSSVSYDLNDKFQAYRRNGVNEYVVWRTQDQAVDWFVLDRGQYVRLQPDQDGLYRSRILPGLWLDPVALRSDDRPSMLRVNAAGTNSPEHAAFVERLRLTKAGG